MNNLNNMIDPEDWTHEDTTNMLTAIRDELELLGVSKKTFAVASYNAAKKEQDNLSKLISELQTEEEREEMAPLLAMTEEYLQRVKETVDNMED